MIGGCLSCGINGVLSRGRANRSSGAVAKVEVRQDPVRCVSAIQVLGLSFRGSIVRSVYIASAPQQGGGVTRLTTWFEDVRSIFCHADWSHMRPCMLTGPICVPVRIWGRCGRGALIRLHVGLEENDVARPGDITQAALRQSSRPATAQYGKGCAALGVELRLAPVRSSVGSGLSLPSACHAAFPRLLVPVGRFTQTVAIRSSKNFSVVQ